MLSTIVKQLSNSFECDNVSKSTALAFISHPESMQVGCPRINERNCHCLHPQFASRRRTTRKYQIFNLSRNNITAVVKRDYGARNK